MFGDVLGLNTSTFRRQPQETWNTTCFRVGSGDQGPGCEAAIVATCCGGSLVIHTELVIFRALVIHFCWPGRALVADSKRTATADSQLHGCNVFLGTTTRNLETGSEQWTHVIGHFQYEEMQMSGSKNAYDCTCHGFHRPLCDLCDWDAG